MFTYLLIIFELSILFLAYWLVYLQKPSVHKVDDDVWGTYAGSQLKSCQSMRLMFSDEFPSGLKSEKIVSKKNS